MFSFGCLSVCFLAGHNHCLAGHSHFSVIFLLVSLCLCLAFIIGDLFNSARLVIFSLLDLLKSHRFELFLLLAAESSLLGESRLGLG